MYKIYKNHFSTSIRKGDWKLKDIELNSLRTPKGTFTKSIHQFSTFYLNLKKGYAKDKLHKKFFQRYKGSARRLKSPSRQMADPEPYISNFNSLPQFRREIWAEKILKDEKKLPIKLLFGGVKGGVK